MKIKAVKTGSDGNLYLMETVFENKYLLECGVDKKSIIKYLYTYNKEYINNYRGCFISHIHSDHLNLNTAKWINQYMPIYSHYEVLEKYKEDLNGRVLVPNKVTNFGDFIVVPFYVEHGNVGNYGYIFKDTESVILFITDFQRFDSNIFDIEFTEIFIECNWTNKLMEQALNETKDSQAYLKFERQYNTHMGLNVLIELLQKLNLGKCKKINLIHASKEVCDKDTAVSALRYILPNIEIEFVENDERL